jgi:dolichol-phosphate mannosyltransferase
VRDSISVVLPAFNEKANLEELLPDVLAVLDGVDGSHEVLVVDDGSTDGTAAWIGTITDRRVRCIRLRRNSGKSAALRIGFEHARGDVIVTMDADYQDDPRELPLLLAALDEVDLVSGRRAVRHDRFVKRTTSRLYNKATSVVSGVPGRDFNSGFKAMRREVAESLELYGELHRYQPVLAAWQGYRVGEVDVEHHARRHGSTKFGAARFWRGMLDLVTVKFLTSYNARPFHFFGGAGFALGFVGMVLLGWMLVLKLGGTDVGGRPALIAGVLLTVIAVQLVSLGLLAELSVHLRNRREVLVAVEEVGRPTRPVLYEVSTLAGGTRNGGPSGSELPAVASQT